MNQVRRLRQIASDFSFSGTNAPARKRSRGPASDIEQIPLISSFGISEFLIRVQAKLPLNTSWRYQLYYVHVTRQYFQNRN